MDGRLPRVNLLGVKLSVLGLEDTLAVIDQAIVSGRRLAISPCPVYTVMMGHERPEVCAALNVNLATPDGMPVVWALRRMGHRAERVYGPDLMLAVCEQSARNGWAHYFYGGADGVPQALAQSMAHRFPGLCVAGMESPPFRPLTPEEDTAGVRRINASGAQVIWVGLGSPKQDIWMADHRSALDAPVLIGVGAAFDFFSGRVAQAPRWMQRTGLEWAHRLWQEPRRLWRRYLAYNPKFVYEVCLQLAGLRHYA